MYNSLNLERCTECIKTIVNNIRCVLCDKIEGTRVRYPCGHVSCSDCGAVSAECSVCITHLSSHVPVIDAPLSQRVRNVLALLKSYHDVFCIDVLRRPRISEQLKIEKELFPNCIQAPTKYFNKRKSLNIPQDKSIRKSTLLPGEEITLANLEMEKSKKYVEQWLMHQEKINTLKSRQPFTSLNVNTPRFNHKTNTLVKQGINNIKNKSKESIENYSKSSRKRKHDLSTTVSEKQSLGQYLRPLNKCKTLGWDPKKHKWEFDSNKYTKDLQGEENKNIEVETFVIEDTQNEDLDKDRLALIAVHEANKREISAEPEVNLHCSEIIKYTDDIERTISNDALVENSNRAQKVPFFKRAIILEKCTYCEENVRKSHTKFEKNLSNDVTFTVDNDSLIATITLSDCVKNSHKKKNASVQTDIWESEKRIVDGCTKELNSLNYTDAVPLERDITSQPYNDINNKFNKPSQDLFVEDVKCSKQTIEKVLKQSKNMKDYKLTIIEESDSDFENENRSLSQFTQSVPGVLIELEQTVVRRKARNSLRRRTPTSTDSSDKENRDPNRKRARKFCKKTNKNK